MAHQPGNMEGITDRTRATAGSAADQTSPMATPANYTSEFALDQALSAISASYYSAPRLATMTQNDKIYALRLNSDSGTV